MRTVSDCPACCASNPTNVAQLDGRSRQAFLEYDQLKYGGLLSGWIDIVPPEILACRACGHAWYRNQPDPEQLAIMYASGRPLLKLPHPQSNTPTSAMQEEMRRLRHLVGIEGRQPSLLDFGSGRGRWARAAVLEGFKVVAYEPSVSRGNENDPPFKLVHSEDELNGSRFDVINLEQVLEHVPDPNKILLNIRSYCSDATIVRITVPNILWCEEGKDIWRLWPFDGQRTHVMAPFEHLHGFTPSSLVNLIKRSGYEHLPLKKTWRNYTIVSLRNLVGKLYPNVAQTIVLAQLKKN